MDGKSFLSLGEGKPVSLAGLFALRVLLGVAVPTNTDNVRACAGSIQVHSLLRSLGFNELYDLKADPLESRNLIYSAQHRMW